MTGTAGTGTRETVLVLTGYDLKSVPVVSWLSDRFRVLLIASRNASSPHEPAAFAEVAAEAEEWRWIDDVFDNYATVEQALAWHERYGIQHVVCLDEFGLISAARIRELLGTCTGQSIESAMAYRVKSRMYEAVAGSVRVPEYAVASTSFEVAAAVRDFGLPVVVKPVDGAASVDTHVLRDQADTDRWLHSHPLAWARPVLVQKYVDGAMYHVDGLTAEGEVHGVTVSAYGSNALAHQNSRSLTSTMVEPGSERYELLVDSARKVVRALPCTGGSSFHAEFFVTGDGEVHFCEVASRTGGGGIRKSCELATGIHLTRAHALLQCGLADEVLPAVGRPDRSARFGFYLEYAPKGRLLSVPEQCGLPGVVGYDVLAGVGKIRDGATSSVDAIQVFIVEAPDNEGFEKTYQTIGDWCLTHRVVADASPSP
ncbi:acetyl-CoA carboxylase biotin carboxylase subunit family protein [Streptomyces sp. cmx-4-9]|uniref:ATP-grasp domain-containing protein n=1 Tax=Streptomyces sp. cmx-4-9 TaxID=2790941 RepID=UPI003980B269